MAESHNDSAVSAEPVETLHDTAMRFIDLDLQLAVVKIGFDLGLFLLLVERQSPISVDEIATLKGSDPELLARILRYLTSHQLIKQTDKDHFTANNITKNLADPRVQGSASFAFHVGFPLAQVFPEHLKENKYQYGHDGRLPWHRAFQTDQDFFPWIQQHPEYLRYFQGSMGLPPKWNWLDVVPVKEAARDALEADPNRVILVDVGGNAGQHSARIVERLPELRGHVLLQDLEETVRNAPRIEGVEAVAHDFFTPQPVKGAKFYYLRRVLHDWNDDKAAEILTNLIPALAPDSQILIDEVALPNVDVPYLAASLDIRIYTITGSGERTIDRWRSLLERVGLEVVDINPYSPNFANSIISAALKRAPAT